MVSANRGDWTALSRQLGIGANELDAMTITDPTTTVQDDIERLRQSPNAPDEFTVSGLVYDVATGIVQQVTGPARLRAFEAADAPDTVGTDPFGFQGKESS